MSRHSAPRTEDAAATLSRLGDVSVRAILTGIDRSDWSPGWQAAVVEAARAAAAALSDLQDAAAPAMRALALPADLPLTRPALEALDTLAGRLLDPTAPEAAWALGDTAKRVARQGRMPGMDADDIAQDLFLDLWRRRAAFDPSRASFATFADRVIAHRVASLLCSTARLRAERQHLSLDEGDDGAERPVLADSLPDPQAVSEADQALALDVRRFLEGLPPALRRCCDLLLTPNLRAASAEAGLHRSTIYENARRLRRLAERAGLRDYVAAPRHFADRTGRCPA